MAEFNRVLGGGIVPGSVVLLGGDPGIGKSTLLLQAAAQAASRGAKALYVSGEESLQQIRMRSDRLGLTAPTLYVLGETNLESLLELGEANQQACPDPTLETTVFNDGSLPAENVLVRYFAGDPDQGGTRLLDHVVPGTLEAGSSITFTVTFEAFPTLLITVYAVVDPENDVEECNDGDNKTQGPQIICFET